MLKRSRVEVMENGMHYGESYGIFASLVYSVRRANFTVKTHIKRLYSSMEGL